MGRPAKSHDEHKLNGTKAHPSTVAGTSNVPLGRPKFPPYMVDEAKPAFKRVCKWMSAAGRTTLTEADRDVIGIYSMAELRYRKFTTILDSEGWIIEFEGESKTNPAAQHFYKAEAKMLECLRELGLTTATKDKVKQAKVNSEAPADPMEELLNRGPVVVPFRPSDVEVEDFPEGKEEQEQ